MSTNAIIQQLEAARSELNSLNAQIADLERRRDIAKAKVEAFALSAKYVADMQPSDEKPKKKGSRTRMPSSDWKRIFSELYSRYDQGFNYDQIMGVGTSLGIELKRPSLRTKMMNLADAGYVERVDNGQFRITGNGTKYFGLVTVVPGTAENPIEAKPIEEWAVNKNEASEHSVQEAPEVTEDVPASSNENPASRLPQWLTPQG